MKGKQIFGGIALGVAVLMTGCRAGEPTPSDNPDGELASSSTVAEPSPIRDSGLHLLHHGDSIRLGVNYEEALKVFEPPKNAFDFAELPPNFRPPYRARGWETAKEGFGTITYNTRVVLAIWQTDEGDLRTYEKLVSAYATEFPTVTAQEVTNGTIRYKFYESNGQRLMILAVPDAGATVHITVALGLSETMSAIGADPAQASQVVSKKLDVTSPSGRVRASQAPSDNDTPSSTGDSTTGGNP
jgi:hypothetical protein